MPPLIDLFRVLRAGEELANAETWKKRQVLVNALTVLLSSGLVVASAYGHTVALDTEGWPLSLALSLLLPGCSMLGPQSPRPIVSDCHLGLAIHRPQGLTEEDTEALRGTLMDPVFTLIPTVMCRF